MCMCSFTSDVDGAPGGFACLGLHSVLAGASLLAHDNTTISYHVQVGSWWLGSGVASDWASLRRWGRHLFCC